MHPTKRLHECVCVRLCVSSVAHLQVELRRERSVLHVADVVLGEVQIGEVAEATERRIMHRADLVLVQPQIHNGAVERCVKAGFCERRQKKQRRRNSLFIVTPLTCWCGRGWPRKAAGSCCRSPATRSPSPPRWASSRLWPPATALLTPGRANRGRSWLWTGPLMKSLRLGYVSAVPVLFSGPFGMSSQYPLEKADQRPSNIYSSGRAPFEKGVSAGL